MENLTVNEIAILVAMRNEEVDFTLFAGDIWISEAVHNSGVEYEEAQEAVASLMEKGMIKGNSEIGSFTEAGLELANKFTKNSFTF